MVRPRSRPLALHLVTLMHVSTRFRPRPAAVLALGLLTALGLSGLSCSAQTSAANSNPSASAGSPSPATPDTPPHQVAQNLGQPQDDWQKMTEAEAIAELQAITQYPLGVAALNQLAIEGFINPTCARSFYVNAPYGGYQTLMRIECEGGAGVSSAIAYDEVRVIFNRFEANIEDFEIERVSTETPASFELPD